MAQKDDQSVQRVFIIRHGERLDNVDYDWVRWAERPYDPPLTDDGVKEASEAGERFKDKVSLGLRTQPLILFLFISLSILETKGSRDERCVILAGHAHTCMYTCKL